LLKFFQFADTFVLFAGVNMNCPGKLGLTPLGCAVQLGSVGMVRALLGGVLDENENGEGDGEPGTPDGMERLEWESEHVEEEGEDQWGSQYRWYASILERTGRHLPQQPLVQNVDVNAADLYCRTALHYAAELGHEELIKELLNAGKNKLKKSPLISS